MSSSASTELERIDPIEALTEKPWINQINAEQLKLLQATVCKGLSGAEVGHFLEIARGLGMNPWANEIWAAKGKGRDGEDGKLLLMVGRDGLIAHAERKFDDYMGYEAGVVYAGDTFERVDPDPAAASIRGRAGVIHRQSKPHDGDLLGAWAVAERRGRPPRYFYVSLDEYMPKSEKKVQYSPWGSAVAIMIEKVPISIVHRTLCGLGSQVYLEEEVARAIHGAPELAPVQDRGALLDAIIDNIPLEQQERAKDLIDEQNSLAPHSWSASKIELVFKGLGSYRASVELEAIERTIEELKARSAIADPPEAEVVPPPLQVGDPVEATAEELETAARIQQARVDELEEALAGDELSEQQRSDAEAELDALTAPLPEGDALIHGSDELPL